MKRLYAYLLNRFIGPFILTFFVCIFILLMQFLWRYLDDLVGKGLETSIIVELMLYAALSLVPMALPLSVLIASLMTFGNLGERLELLAIKSSGVSLLKIMKPLIVMSVFIAVVAFFLADQVIPVTNTKFAALLWSVKEQRPEMIIKEGAFSNQIDGYSIKVNKRDQDSDALLGIMIYDHTAGKGNVSVTLADSGFLNISDDKQYMILTLFRGETYSDEKPGSREQRKTYPFRRERFDQEELVINVKDYNLKRVDDNFFKDGYKMLKNSQLNMAIDSLGKIYDVHKEIAAQGISYNNHLNEEIRDNFRADSLKKALVLPEDKPVDVCFDSLFAHLSTDQKNLVLTRAQQSAQSNQRNIMQYDTDLNNRLKWISRYMIEWHRKYTLSLACIIFFFIGAPLGAIIRKGGFGMPVVVSVLMFIAYYVISMITENLARTGGWTVSWSMWFSTFLFLVVSLFLTYEAVTDSLLLSRESYVRLMARINIFRKLYRDKKALKNENTFSDE